MGRERKAVKARILIIRLLVTLHSCVYTRSLVVAFLGKDSPINGRKREIIALPVAPLGLCEHGIIIVISFGRH